MMSRFPLVINLDKYKDTVYIDREMIDTFVYECYNMPNIQM